MRWAVGVSVVIAGFSVLLDPRSTARPVLIVHRFFTLERIGNSILATLLLVIAVYLTWFPVKLRRNIVVYSLGFSIFFAARCVGLLAVNLLPPSQVLLLSNLMLAAEVVCLAFWVFAFTPEKEDQFTITGHRWNPEEYERLNAQLNSINALFKHATVSSNPPKIEFAFRLKLLYSNPEDKVKKEEHHRRASKERLGNVLRKKSITRNDSLDSTRLCRYRGPSPGSFRNAGVAAVAHAPGD